MLKPIFVVIFIDFFYVTLIYNEIVNVKQLSTYLLLEFQDRVNIQSIHFTWTYSITLGPLMFNFHVEFFLRELN